MPFWAYRGGKRGLDRIAPVISADKRTEQEEGFLSRAGRLGRPRATEDKRAKLRKRTRKTLENILAWCQIKRVVKVKMGVNQKAKEREDDAGPIDLV
jgi:hypothetical protein